MNTTVEVNINTLTVYVKETDEGVVVDICPNDRRHPDLVLASTFAFFTEGDLESDY